MTDTGFAQMYLVVAFKIVGDPDIDRRTLLGCTVSHVGGRLDPPLTQAEMSQIMLAARLELGRIEIARTKRAKKSRSKR